MLQNVKLAMAEWLKMAENVKLLEWLEIAGNGLNCWNWLKFAGMAGNTRNGLITLLGFGEYEI